MTAVSSFEGADVDGLDRLAREFEQAAQVCDEVKAACEVIVAASFVFGPFGAAFVSYLKTVVIPWLTKISEALRLMAKVLSFHSQAQRDASSAATSLPSYTTPGNLPAGSTRDYPVMTAAPAPEPVTTTSYLGGLVTVGTDRAGHVVDVHVGAQLGPVSEQADLHVEQIRDAHGTIIGTRLTGSASDAVAGVPLVRLSGTETVAGLTDAHGIPTDLHEDGSVSLVLGPGTPDGIKPGSLPGGARVPNLPGAEGESGFAYHPPELTIGSTVSSGPTFGDALGGSVLARAGSVTFSGAGQDDHLTMGLEGKLAAEANGGFFLGTEHWQGETARGALGTVEAGAGVGFTGGAQVGSEHTNVFGTGGFGLGPGLGFGGYAVQHGPDGAPTYDAGGSGEVDEFTVGGRIHHQSDGR